MSKGALFNRLMSRVSSRATAAPRINPYAPPAESLTSLDTGLLRKMRQTRSPIHKMRSDYAVAKGQAGPVQDRVRGYARSHISPSARFFDPRNRFGSRPGAGTLAAGAITAAPVVDATSHSIFDTKLVTPRILQYLAGLTS